MNTETFNIQTRNGRPNIQGSARRRLGDWLVYAGCWIFCTALAGCALGPNFKKPAAPNISGYTTTPLSTTVAARSIPGGGAQHFVEGLDIPAEWWTVFHSKPLNDLIERSLTNNPDIKAAQAALQVARENVLAQAGAYYPAVTGSFSANRQRESEVLAPVPNYPTVSSEFTYDLFTPQLSVSYTPDVFGLNRRTVESLNAQEEQARFAMVATRITLSANIVVAAIQEASLRAQIDATREIIEMNSNMVRVLRAQFAHGYASRLDVAAQETQLAQVSATLPPLLTQLAQQQDALAVLAGGVPNQAPIAEFYLSSLHLPEELPVSLPSQLIEQRPDVRQAEENMHAASAQIGVAVANRLPNITLTADAGSTALAINQVFSSGTGFWGLGAAATAPLFEGGALLHKERAAKAAYLQAAEEYRSTVHTAFENVADTLNALEGDANAVKTAAAAADAAKATLNITRQEMRLGYANNLALLSSEQAYQQTEITLVQAEANRFSDTAALFQALGGGWWNQGKEGE